MSLVMILITGENGLVGKMLSDLLTARAVEWQGFGSDWRFGKPIPEFKGAKLLIHCAYNYEADFDSDGENLNFTGARQLLDWSTAREIHFINVSTVLASFKTNLYGTQKKLIELEVESRGQTNVRFGVFNTSPEIGFLDSVAKLSNKSKVVLIPGLKFRVFETTHADVTSFIELMTHSSIAKYSLIQAHSLRPVKLIDLLKKHDFMGRKPFFLNINPGFLLFCLKFAERAGVKFTSIKESLIGLIKLQESFDSTI